MEKTCIILSGGTLPAAFARERIETVRPDVLIAADRGLQFCTAQGILPDIALGDFDSCPDGAVEEARAGGRIRLDVYPPEKDWTDTELAIRTALREGCGRIHVLGGTGTRLDHVLGNILMLRQYPQCVLEDPCNRISAHDRPFEVEREAQWGTYVSFFALGGPVAGLTLEGFRYPVRDVLLENSSTMFLSNEIAEETGLVAFESGMLLMIESRDRAPAGEGGDL